jgi:hypothetical protein
LLLNDIRFSNNQKALAVQITSVDELQPAIEAMNLLIPAPVIVLSGGAKGIGDDKALVIMKAVQVIARVAEEANAVVVDGGTRSGVMAEMGRARGEGGYRFPLLGVAVARLVFWIDHPQRDTPLTGGKRRWPLEEHHSHFILVPGHRWGDESWWIAGAATLLARQYPSLTVLINGWEVARQDVAHSLQADREVLVLVGSGRLADDLAHAMGQHEAFGDARFHQLIGAGRISLFDISNSQAKLTGLIRRKLQIS